MSHTKASSDRGLHCAHAGALEQHLVSLRSTPCNRSAHTVIVAIFVSLRSCSFRSRVASAGWRGGMAQRKANVELHDAVTQIQFLNGSCMVALPSTKCLTRVD
jgi:hypothetical protein